MPAIQLKTAVPGPRSRELMARREAAVPRVIREAYERGLLTITAGTYGNIVRTLMPLVISDDELREGLGVQRPLLPPGSVVPLIVPPTASSAAGRREGSNRNAPQASQLPA